MISIGAVLLTVLLAGAALEACFRPHSSYVVYEAYYKCESRKGLEGGIYGKGPMKRFGPRYCNDWSMIDKKEFMQLASEWYGVRWENEIEWWRRP
jgi:hypothetical protein